MICDLSHLALWRTPLRVLCYHHVQPARRGRLSVTPRQLDAHIDYLQGAGFTFIHAKELLEPAGLPQRPLLLTFDNGYADNATYAQQILAKRRAKATMFVATGRAGRRAEWDPDASPLMGVRDMRALDPELIELALHSHEHRAFALLSTEEIERDLESNIEFFEANGLPFTRALAYPYGSRPLARKGELSAMLSRLGIALAFRAGNRVNRLPLRCPHDIQRIDVSGASGTLTFKRNLWLGSLAFSRSSA